ncbi:hypothetical protein H5410_045771 [Solanum commersonii]|uniref:Uncharacterized protein n=1 Tax=Solanum commersonii TaxID=4109 RepID=A0A9J5XAG4_SOLCO|nr:hypothetical protein H5410_045771 [Solanum commersonii]
MLISLWDLDSLVMLYRCGSTCVTSTNKEIKHESLKWNTTLPNIHGGTILFVPFKLACSCSGLKRIKFLGEVFTPTLDVVLVTILREETRLGTQAAMESMQLPVVALLAQKSTIGTSSGNSKRTNCPKKKKFCAYCKITNHYILDCRRHPSRSRPVHQAYQTDATKSIGSFASGHDLERLI